MEKTDQILVDPATYQLPANKVLVLRSCNPDMTAYGGFKWPESGPVEAPTEWNEEWGEEPTQSDIKLCWDPGQNCGGGLHGWLWAVGDYGLKYNDPKAKYLVVEVEAEGLVNLNGKVKFQKGIVILTGTYRQAYDLVMKWYWLRHAEKMRTVEAIENTSSTTGEAAPPGMRRTAAPPGNVQRHVALV